jgi:hypothetical protein
LAFDDLRERLLLGGIAPRHVRRYLRELSEHLDDLTAQQRQAGYDGEEAASRARARLGDDEELAAAMLAQKQLRSWTARAPWAVFLVLPPIAAVAIGFLFIGSMVLIEKYFGFMEHRSLPPYWFQLLATNVVAACNLTAVPLSAILFVAIAARQRLKLIWPFMASLLLLVLVVRSEAVFSAHDKSHLSLGLGLALLPRAWTKTGENWLQIGAQYAMTILPVLWLWRRRVTRT